MVFVCSHGFLNDIRKCYPDTGGHYLHEHRLMQIEALTFGKVADPGIAHNESIQKPSAFSFKLC